MKKIKLEIPARFANVNYEKDVLQSIKDYVEAFNVTRKGLYLFGGVGTGKTHTAYAICKKLEEDGRNVRAFTALDILRMVKEDMNFENNRNYQTYGDKYFGDSNQENIRFYDGINDFKGLLFIDDVGVEKTSEWVLETFYSIIDKKYINLLPVIMTSNCNLEELSRKLNDKIASRIAQMCEIIPMTGKDRRLLADNLNTPYEKS